MKYHTIVADPPWHYDGFASMPGAPGTKRKTKVTNLPYGSMTLREIADLPVESLAAKDCFLFCWTTNRYLPDTFPILEEWGFTYRQTLVWHKTGSPSPFGGSVAPNHAEFLLVATKGKPQVASRLKGSVFPVPKPYQHSKKPEAFLDFIEQCAPGPYVELFARRARFGWDYWGNESLGTASMEAVAA